MKKLNSLVRGVSVIGVSALLLAPAHPRAQQEDPEAAANAKAAAGQEAQSSHLFTSPLGPKAAGTFVTFDAPGAGTGFFQGTFPASINEAGDITGSYDDANGVSHAFVRAGNGTFTTFDVPGGTTTGSSSINSAATVTGSYFYLSDPNFVSHGFLRNRNGSFSTFDAPNSDYILTSSINPAAVVTGTDFDADFVIHGFLRSKDGVITTIDAPGADNNPNDFPNGTVAVGVNPDGVVLGTYSDINQNNHGFLRAIDGSFTIFDPPGQIRALFVPFAFGPSLYMNAQGVITGTYFQLIPGNPFGGNYRVFVRATDGSFATFDAVPYPNGNPSLNIYCCTWSFPSGITPSGAITGSFNDEFTHNHGFLRTSDGTVTTFDVPAAGTGFNQGTAPLGITPSGVIMGIYIDANYVHHGFLFFPRSCC